MPTIEVSEDCISRADLIQELCKDAERVEMEEFANDTVWRTIATAPSVVPRRQSRAVTSVCRWELPHGKEGPKWKIARMIWTSTTKVTYSTFAVIVHIAVICKTSLMAIHT